MSSSQLQAGPDLFQPKAGWELFPESSPEHAWGKREAFTSSSSSWRSSSDKVTEESFVSDQEHSDGSNERPSTAFACEKHGMENNDKQKEGMIILPDTFMVF